MSAEALEIEASEVDWDAQSWGFFPKPLDRDEEQRYEILRKVLRTHVVAGMASGAIPSPIFDWATILVVQLNLLAQICKIYGLKFSRNLGKSIIGSLLAALGAPTLGLIFFSSVVKMAPGLGTVMGIVTQPLTAGAVTYAVGKVFILHFEAGGTLFSFNPKAMRQHFLDEFENGKKAARSAGTRDSATAKK